jgi:ribosomal protein S18 acetylase RimI-like enzyme
LKVITVRAEQIEDEAFLFELYCSTRRQELDAWGWTPSMQDGFLKMQFRATQGHRRAYPQADYQIVLLDGLKAGRLAVHRNRDEVHLVDLALLPQFRNGGVGTELIRQLCHEAEAAKQTVRLQLLKGNRAERLFRRLGFVKIDETELHAELKWPA